MQDFEKLIDKNKTQVFLLSSRCSFPFNFALHLWFVINRKGIISRWEVIHLRNVNNTSWGHLHKNFIPPFEGLWYIRYLWRTSHKAELLTLIDEEQLAEKIAAFIEKTPVTYPYCNIYSFFPGPNSDTYIHWILNHFPEVNIKLPWNAIGKGYQVDISAPTAK